MKLYPLLLLTCLLLSLQGIAQVFSDKVVGKKKRGRDRQHKIAGVSLFITYMG
jgi:hypothetical protein